MYQWSIESVLYTYQTRLKTHQYAKAFSFLWISYVYSFRSKAVADPEWVMGFSRTPSLPPVYKYPMEMKKMWFHEDQIISFSWDIYKK